MEQADPTEGIRQRNITFAQERRRELRLRRRLLTVLAVWAAATLFIAIGLMR